MDVEPFLHQRKSETVVLPTSLTDRRELQRLFGEELHGEPIEGRHGPMISLRLAYDYQRPSVSAGDLFGDGREWIVVDTAFGCRYLVLADHLGGFVLLAMLPGVPDVLVEFDRPVPTNHPNRHDDDYIDPVPARNRKQYINFLEIANELVFQAEMEQRS